ncbi:TetR/AcrR family transcriptional regulator [Agromyces sp. SYSU K20354]|uniref:TetR/AcrR family transcriptional regulator n=1 Tax=Agromyces cavernae TaxID=2898659 RepID=UPI001E4877B6|nr:TetR/AcrR family transcriptional regulator [Agromyces cavernae]MCD2443672.1 TetR/AcrR family transcriptional regulator [Agromyces cavernae]
MSTTRQRWLDEGLAVLAVEGEAGLRIDRIASRLGLTKGSFFHHFEGAPGYREALLDEYERQTLDALADAIEARRGGDTRSTLAWLTELATSQSETIRRPGLDLAVRAWAAADPVARATQARIDAAVIDALQAAWRPAVESDGAARIAALVPYLVSLGAAMTVPPIAPDELRRVYELLLEAVPGDAASR